MKEYLTCFVFKRLKCIQLPNDSDFGHKKCLKLFSFNMGEESFVVNFN